MCIFHRAQARMYACKQTINMHVCMHACTYVRMHVWVFMYVCMYVFPKRGDLIIVPSIVGSLFCGPQKRYPLIFGNSKSLNPKVFIEPL